MKSLVKKGKERFRSLFNRDGTSDGVERCHTVEDIHESRIRTKLMSNSNVDEAKLIV